MSSAKMVVPLKFFHRFLFLDSCNFLLRAHIHLAVSFSTELPFFQQRNRLSDRKSKPSSCAFLSENLENSNQYKEEL